MRNEVIKIAEKLNIDLIGITNFDQNDDLDILNKQQYLNPFINKKRLTPNQELSSFKQAIVIGMSYPSYDKKLEDDYITSFSNSSWGTDYHVVVKNKLQELTDGINRLIPNFEYKICVDTGPINERLLGKKAGLGFIGKNNMLINQELGSYFFIGVLLTNLDLEIDKPLESKCSSCNKCIKACPTNALEDNDSLKCISYLTQKKELNAEESKYINNNIFGCTICQKVCPYNKGINNVSNKEFIPTGIEFIKDKEAFNITNKEFKLKYGHLAGSFIGKNKLKRNLELIIKNNN